MTPVRCVVFDVDDTLYLERDYVRSGFRAVGEHARLELGVDGFFDRAWGAFSAGARGSVFDQVLKGYGLEPGRIVPELVRIYRTHRPSISLLPDARDCLDRLHGQRALAAVTGGPASSQRAKAETLGLARWMAPILFTGDLGGGFEKPSPEAFRLVEEAVGAKGPACVYVADDPATDFRGPASLAWVTVRVRRPEGLHASVDGSERADVEIPDLSRLEEAIDRAG